MNSPIGSRVAVAAFAIAAILAALHSIMAQKASPNSPPLNGLGGRESDSGSNIQPISALPPGIGDAPERLVDGRFVLRLQSSIWRDLMPFASSLSGPAGLAARSRHTAINAIIRLSDEQGAPLPQSLHADTIWILQGKSAWKTSTIQERRNAEGASAIELVIHDGPTWRVGSAVDVVIRLKGANGKTSLLANRNQSVGGID
jgi:hypothetical protein